MRQSVSEAKTLLIKAGCGVGVPIGLLEDLAPAALWLQACGRSGFDQALAAMRSLDEGRAPHAFYAVSNADPIDPSKKTQVSSIYLLAQLGDRLQIGRFAGSENSCFYDVDYPELVAATLVLLHRDLELDEPLWVLAATAEFLSKPRGEGILVQMPSVRHPRSENAGLLLVSAEGAHESKRSIDILLDADTEAVALESARTDGLTVNADTVQGLRSFALRLLVPESEQSLRFGAGAGINDTD